jgi:predicted GIY-YIG superfamily endonuclease
MTFNFLECFDENIDNLDITKNYIYVLKLIDDRYYVGRSGNILRRIEEHFTIGGSIYTKAYKPLKVIEVNEELTTDDERIKTLEIMEKYGWEKVRGACWCSLKIRKPYFEKNKKLMEKNTYRNKGYWDRIRISNEDKEYPSNMGQKWSNEEEILLLEEVNNNIDIEIIAQNHNRTIGGINSRLREIAYKMYLKNVSIEEIIRQTKLNNNSIEEIIKKRQNNNSKKIKTKEIDNVFISINKNDYIELQNDVKNMKNDIKQIKNTLGELVEMMKAVYEFEDT